MKLFKGNYGWSTSAHSKTKEGKELKCYIDTQFAKHSEPDGTDIDGDLVFRSKGGKEFTCFFSSYEKKGIITPKLVLMPTDAKREQTSLTRDDGKDMFGRKQDLTIDPEELPFY